MPWLMLDGNLSYDRIIPASALPEARSKLPHLHIVQHGLDVNGNDKYDLPAARRVGLRRVAGVEGIPEEATNPGHLW